MTPAFDHAVGTRTARALRRLPAAGARLRLVRPDLLEAAAAFCVVLLHHLPGVVDAVGKALHRHG